MLKSKYILAFLCSMMFCMLFACSEGETEEEVEKEEEEIGIQTKDSKTKKNNQENDKYNIDSNIDFEITDDNGNGIYEIGEELLFELRGAVGLTNPESFEWEFGDGGDGRGDSVKYQYPEKGKYLVSLFLDDKIVQEKVLKVRQIIKPSPRDTLVKIFGPVEGYVNTDLVFRAHGTGVGEWSWEFGEEPGLISSENTAQVVHKYRDEGIYTIKVTTNLSEYPVKHQIKILPQFEVIQEVTDTIDTLQLYADDIKKHLQAIADAPIYDSNTFFSEKNYIVEKYICDLEELVVVINSSTYNDFLSYCQGIHHLYSKADESLSIQEVVIDTTECITRIEVTEVPAGGF